MTSIVATESQWTPDRTTAVRSVCESFQLLLSLPLLSHLPCRSAVGESATRVSVHLVYSRSALSR
ncbi:hypothetical protein E2L06_12290 [Haloterrigena sp. H1]|nr:hypothetical protein E2L06_12290 [Haloterrigena sp. H1]